jgi:hypothetical protein
MCGGIEGKSGVGEVGMCAEQKHNGIKFSKSGGNI